MILWTDEDTEKLIDLKEHQGASWRLASDILGRSTDSCRTRYKTVTKQKGYRIAPSPMNIYNQALTMEGDALIMADTEFPFHNADFINNCLELSQSWKITQAIIAGDVLHFDSLSTWGAQFEHKKSPGLTEDQELELRSLLTKLPDDEKPQAEKLLDSLVNSDDTVSTELAVARQELHKLSQVFHNVDYILGNHESRLVKALKTPMFPEEILRLLELKEWRIAPYYWSTLISNKEVFQIEHPYNSDKNAPLRLADIFQSNIIAGHSHLLSFQFSSSGKYYAIYTGCCVDEKRLIYASQRHNTRQAHSLGATIVRDGVPYILHSKIDWKRMKRL